MDNGTEKPAKMTYAQMMAANRERVAMSTLDRWFARFCNKIDWLEESILKKMDNSYFDETAKYRYRFTGAMLDEFVKSVNDRMSEFSARVKSAYALADAPFEPSGTVKKHIND